LADTAPVLIWQSGPDAACLYFNQPWLTFTGRTLAQEIGDGWTQGVHPDDSARCLLAYRAAFHAHQPFTIEYRLRRADGEYRWLLDTGVPYSQPDGTFGGYIGSCVDVTAQQQLATALRQQEQAYRQIIDQAADGIFVADASGQYVEVNRAGCELLGYTRDELLRLNIRNLVAPDDLVAQPLRYADLQSGRAVSTYRRMVRKDGTLVPVEISGQMLDDGRLLGLVRDVTERLRADAAIRDGAASLRALMNAADESILLMDIDGVIIALNDTTATRLHSTVDQMVGRSIYEFLPEATRLQRRAHAAQVVATGAPARFEDERFNRWIDNSIYPVIDEQGRVVRLAVYGRDITDRKQTEDTLRELNVTLEQRVSDRTHQLAEANLRLAELDQMKDEFISRIGHELRTPLTNIKIYLELLEMGKPEKREKYLQILQREADRLHVLIEDLLQVSHLSAAAIEVVLTPENLNRLISDRLVAWGEQAARRSLELQVELADDLPLALADRDLTAQVIAHVVHNAISYTPDGLITLSTAARSDETGRWVTVSVQDTGPGITPDELPHVFDRFYRGRAAADYKTPGTGIGLSIAREIAEKLGGRLTVETQVGVGSTFMLWLPVA
jgi:PAS domain S-box-containing protein